MRKVWERKNPRFELQTHLFLDVRLNLVFNWTVKLLTVSQLKASAGQILDRAISGKPQYVVRDGALVMISRAEFITGVEERAPGYFADAYANPEPDRLAFEKAMAKIKQRLGSVSYERQQAIKRKLIEVFRIIPD